MCLPVHNGAYLTICIVLSTVQYTHQDATIPQKELKSDTQDRIYISPDGINCTGCDVGEYVETHCNEPMGKSQCKPCPTRTFSQTRGGATSCQDCTPCSQGAVPTSRCTATSDRVCECPEGTEPIISNGVKHGCRPFEAPALLPSTTEYETTTKQSVSSSQEYQSRTTTHVPASNGYETNATGSDWIVIGSFFAGFLLGVVFIIVILYCYIRAEVSKLFVSQYSWLFHRLPCTPSTKN